VAAGKKGERAGECDGRAGAFLGGLGEDDSEVGEARVVYEREQRRDAAPAGRAVLAPEPEVVQRPGAERTRERRHVERRRAAVRRGGPCIHLRGAR